MKADKPLSDLREEYEEAARKYMASLPLEHFVESTPQATQRKITVESFDLVHVRRPDVQCFNELLIQYPRGKKRKARVVPDNMVVVHPEPIEALSSFSTPFQPVGPFLVLEYVTPSNMRKDYEDNFVKYERDLKVPYYLLFYPDNQELTLYRHNGERYVTVTPGESGRYGIPELELEVAILDGWVRYWVRGALLPLPADLQHEVDDLRRQTVEANRRADEEARRAAEEGRRAEEQASRAEEANRRAEEERQARLAAEKENARLRALLEQLRPPGRPDA